MTNNCKTNGRDKNLATLNDALITTGKNLTCNNK